MVFETFATSIGETAERTSEVVESAREKTRDVVDSFDPDKRIELERIDGDATDKVEFNPDDRIENGRNTSEPFNDDVNEKEKHEPIQNKKEGCEREEKVYDDLKKEYPESEGYTIKPEVYLKDQNGKIVKDPVTGEARRIDFVVVKDDKVVDSVEVTSKTVDKTEQSAKEDRIRNSGGNFVKIDDKGTLAEMPTSVKTRIERRD